MSPVIDMPPARDGNGAPARPKVMIVEDESIVALDMQERLAALGYEVTASATSGETALREAAEIRPDVVLMDIRIQGPIDGIETAARLQAHDPVPIVYLTSYSDDATLERARATQPYGFLIKPFSERELHATLQMTLERRRLEKALQMSDAQLRALNENLEQLVAQRTAALEASVNELRAFSYALAHDLRAPLRHLIGFSAILLSDHADGLEPGAVSYLERLRETAERMGRMVDSLLELARLSHVVIRRRKLNLSTLVVEIAEELRAAGPERKVEWIVAPDLAASADPGLIEIVLGNLLRNAWKYTSHHTSARIEFGATKAEGETAFFVRDDGAGFDMAQAGKLFGAFNRLHHASEFEGLGIGLAIAQRIVRLHGGRIWARAEPEKGATFYFTLPEPSEKPGAEPDFPSGAAPG